MDDQRIPCGPRESLRIALVTEAYPPEVNGVAPAVAHLVGGPNRKENPQSVV